MANTDKLSYEIQLVLLNPFVLENYGVEGIDKFLEDSVLDFKVYLCYLWTELGLPLPTKRQLEMADFLQEDGLRKVLMAFRGIGKSWITAAYCSWRLLRNTEERILICSCALDKSLENAKFIQDLILTVPLLTHLRPRSSQRTAVGSFDVGPASPSQSPSVKAVGITGRKTGSRASLILADDVESPENSLTETRREGLLRAVNEFGSILMPETEEVKPTIIYLGTPQTEETIYGNLVDRDEYEARIWPARYPDKPQVYTSKGGKRMLASTLIKELNLDTNLTGKATDPERFDELELLSKAADMTPTDFELQFMLNTQLADIDRYPLKLSDLIVMEGIKDRAPIEVFYGGASIEDLPNPGFKGDRFRLPQSVGSDWSDYSQIVMAIDPSGRGKDETAYAIVGELSGRLYLLKCGGFADGYGDGTLEALSQLANEYNCTSVVIEANFGDGMYTKLFTPVLHRVHPRCSVEEVKHNQQKEVRIIDTIFPLIRRHKLIVDKEVVLEDILGAFKNDARKSLWYQLTHICYDRGALRHDDRLDVLSIAVAFFTELMSKDEAKEADRHSLREIEEAQRQWARRDPRGYRRWLQMEGIGKAKDYTRDELRMSKRDSKSSILDRGSKVKSNRRR